MAHYGQKQFKFKRNGDDTKVMSLNFKVADVTKPLVAVRRIVGRGNDVHFDNCGGWIMNVASGKRIPLTKKGGCYVLSVELFGEGRQQRAGAGSLGTHERPDGGRGDRGCRTVRERRWRGRPG